MADYQGSQSVQLIRVVDQGDRQGGPWFPISPPHQLQWCDRELHFLVAGGLVGIVTGLAYTQHFPWRRNPSLKSSMGKICQDPHIQLFIDFRWSAQSLTLMLLTLGPVTVTWTLPQYRSALRTWLLYYPNGALKTLSQTWSGRSH